MNRIKLFLSAVAMSAALAFNAQALTLTPADADGSGDQNNTSDILAHLGITDADFVYKQNQGGSESGQFKNSYTTAFYNTATDPKDATITYVNGKPAITTPATLLVKDGNQTPAWYIFDLGALGWNGTEQIVLNDFWPDQGAISFVGIYSGGGTSVPDGGATAVLLGLGFLSLAAFARKKS